MNYPIPISGLSPQLEYFEEVTKIHAEATEYMLAHKWCKQIRNGWLYTNIGYPLCIFLFEIENLQSPEDELLWVMAGDFPLIYLDTYNVKSTREVVRVYVKLAEQWLKAEEAGKSLTDYYPFKVPDGKEFVELFRNKVELLKKVMVEQIDDIVI
jgi:hypothetical protein